eukprot:TRINITY_DN50210_c0_g1_i1.p1 TRINITY_DN50210_c0_g1~~TRINITY_DN50210_c0_g1_i1.p1  ORF type:complete len:800 (+),score=226.43 TRINITY_DN50210_c0_g1_i1:89-2401(+)
MLGRRGYTSCSTSGASSDAPRGARVAAQQLGSLDLDTRAAPASLAPHPPAGAAAPGRGPTSPLSPTTPTTPIRPPTSPTQRMRWRRGALLGQGAYGSVFAAFNEDTGELHAVKSIVISPGDPRLLSVARQIQQEVKMMRRLKHPNIVRLLGCTWRGGDTPGVDILMEYVSGGSLQGMLQEYGALPDEVAKCYTLQLVEAVCYLHGNDILHRDLKGANVLVTCEGALKVADFGGAQGTLEEAEGKAEQKLCGTPNWMAPEVLREEGHSKASDVWSLGCTTMEMLTAKAPWHGVAPRVMDVLQLIAGAGPVTDAARSCVKRGGGSEAAAAFVARCCEKDPGRRPSSASLASARWLQGFDLSTSASVDCSRNGHGEWLQTVRARDGRARMSVREMAAQRRDTSATPPKPELRAAEGVRWRVGACIGAGAHGTVRVALSDRTGELLAVKTVAVNARERDAGMRVKQLQQEISLMKRLDHPHIVRYVGAAKMVGGALGIDIVMEYVPGGSVRAMLRQYGALTEPVAASYVRMVGAGVAYLHSNDIVHRDLKSANLLVGTNGVVKVADFGASASVADLGDGKGSTMCGTPRWMAPEVVREEDVGGEWKPADIWAFGCTVMEMASAEDPWAAIAPQQICALNVIAGTEELCRNAGELMRSKGYSDAAADLVRLCIQKQIAKRIDITRLCAHDWVSSAPADPELSASLDCSRQGYDTWLAQVCARDGALRQSLAGSASQDPVECEGHLGEPGSFFTAEDVRGGAASGPAIGGGLDCIG